VRAVTRCCLGAVACAATLHAQPPKRVPVIAGAMHVRVVVDADGTVRSWGSPWDAEGPYLGDGSDGSASRKTLAPVPGMHDIVDAAVGLQHVLLLSRDGTVFAWGRNNECEVGTGDDKRRLTPVPVAGLRDVTAIAAGELLSGAVLADGSVRMWGSGRGGLLANGQARSDCAKSPVPVEGITGAKRIAIDASAVYVLKTDGTVWGWGRNSDGELCDGTTERRLHPVQMQGVANVVDIAVDGHAVMVLADGTVRSCGGPSDEAPKGTPKNTVYKVPGVAGAVAVQAAGGATMVRLRDGTLLGWGVGYQGRLGDGHGDRETSKPHAPVGLGPVIAFYYASNEGYAVKADGTVMAWGIWADGKGPTEWVLKPIPIFTVKLDP
jgi:alpha-tubulin suppressor-like RCC1 family protein